MKPLSSKKCSFPQHTDRAATCELCYDFALEQQRAQDERECKRLHAQYLLALGKAQAIDRAWSLAMTRRLAEGAA